MPYNPLDPPRRITPTGRGSGMASPTPTASRPGPTPLDRAPAATPTDRGSGLNPARPADPIKSRDRADGMTNEARRADIEEHFAGLHRERPADPRNPPPPIHIPGREEEHGDV